MSDLKAIIEALIFACGDAAHLAHAPRPKAGVYAVRAAPALFANLRAALSGSPRKPFDPQGDYLKLISLGRRSAVGERNGITLEGPWVWRLKDRIDRRFIPIIHGRHKLPAAAVGLGYGGFVHGRHRPIATFLHVLGCRTLVVIQRPKDGEPTMLGW